MSRERFVELIHEVCAVVGLPDAEYVVDTQTLEIEGFDVHLDHHEADPDSVYVSFHYGAVTPGRWMSQASATCAVGTPRSSATSPARSTTAKSISGV